MSYYIAIRTSPDRCSSLYVPDDGSALQVVGVIPHNANFAPATIEDADNLIAYLQAFKEAEKARQKLESDKTRRAAQKTKGL